MKFRLQQLLNDKSIVTRFLALALLSNLAANQSLAAPTNAQAQSQSPTLTALQDKDKDGDPSHAFFSFGTLDTMDMPPMETEAEKQLDKKEPWGPAMPHPGFAHLFFVRNVTQKQVTVEVYEKPWYIFDVNVATSGNFIDVPYPFTIAANTTTQIEVSSRDDIFM